MIADVGGGALQVFSSGRVGDEVDGFAPRRFQNFRVAQDVGYAQGGQARLLRAEELARAAQPEIHFGNVKTIGRIHQGANALARGIVHFLGHEDAVALRSPTADTPAQLVQLREAEAFRLLDQHDGGVGHIHADFNHRGRDQDFDFALFEALHGSFFFVASEAAVYEAHGDLREDLAGEVLIHVLRRFHGLRFRLLDDRIDDVCLPALIHLLLQEAVDLLDAIGGGVFGDDGLSARRKLVDDGDVEIAVQGHGESARNGGGGHHEYIGVDAFLDETEPLHDAKAMLLVDNGEAETLEFDVLFKKRVRADDHVNETFGDEFFELGLFAGAEGAGEQSHDVTHLAQDLAEVETVLRGQNFGGSEDGHLVPIFDGDDGGFRGNDGFAAAHVALQEAVHGARGFHIVGDFLDHTLLRLGGLEGQHGLNLLAHAVVDFESDSRDGFGFAAFESDAALEPEEFFEDEAELVLRAKLVQQAEVGLGPRKMGAADSGPAVGQFEPLEEIQRQMIFERIDGFEHAV